MMNNDQMKRISLSDDTFEALSKACRPGESYSDALRRLMADLPPVPQPKLPKPLTKATLEAAH